jgi:hypothetical protein
MLLPQRPVSGPLAARVSSLHTALVVASVSLARQSAATAAAAAAQPAAAELGTVATWLASFKFLLIIFKLSSLRLT